MITRSPQRVAEKPTRWSSPGLRVSSPLDHSEREADTTATHILTMPTPSSQPAGLTTTTSHIQRCPGGCHCTEEIHRQPQEEDEEELQLKPNHTTPTGTVTSTDIASLGTGQPLPKSTRSFFEPRFGTDLSQVRIHTNTRAGQLAHQVGAKAFTYHQNIAFAPGHYQPHTTTGKHLIAHELTHTIQQKHGAHNQAVVRQADAGVPDADISDAGIGDEASTRQMECVIRLGGCTNTRSAGVPTDREIADYNTSCRSDSNYEGPDVTPSESDCQSYSTLDSLAWAQSLNRRYPNWLNVLPDCPCTDTEARSSDEWSGPGGCGGGYHPGAASGYRSKASYESVPGTEHGQQCCYDSEGRLITEGAGAGTPDVVQAPSGFWSAVKGTFWWGPGVGSVIGHYYKDVVPYNDLGSEVYNRYWVPNNGNNCEENRKP